tara:strand:- start:6241 stop:7206 length:966 start_codon:yes stop_codon:yes gene_type:complete
MYKRDLITNQKLIITDGLPGGGKALMCNLISGLPKVDQWIMDYWLDQIVPLFNSKKIDLDTATYLLKTNHNSLSYDNIILRTSNFRKSDLTSITKHPRYKFFKPRMNPDSDKVFKRFKKKVIIQYCTHLNSNFSKPFFKAFTKQLLYIQLFRSPVNLQMLKYLASWVLQWEKIKTRDGWIKFYDKKTKKNYPHFVSDVLKTYFKANKFEKVVIILEKIYNNKKINLNKYEKEFGSKVIRVPFENLIINPSKYLKKISKHLNVKIDKVSLNVMKKNKVPRMFDLKNHNNEGINFMKKKVNKNYFKRLIKINEFYEKKILNNY